MDDLWLGFGAVAVVCLLLMILGLEIRITRLARLLDEREKRTKDG